jgi:tRNA(Arg) A34 adenosine deaminase TadA
MSTERGPDMDFAQRAIDLARHNVAEGGRPFATVIVKDGDILAESANTVAQSHDPSWPRSATSSARIGSSGDYRCVTTLAVARSRCTACGENATAVSGR